MTTKQELSRQLRALGIRKGDVLLVHSAMKPLGPVEGDCAGVLDVLAGLLTGQGTLLLPALTYTTVTREQPVFSVRESPSCVGRLSETFRLTPGVRRSVHPTHSVCAAGRLAQELTGGHLHDRTPVGPRSPFRRLAECGGKILMLGCGLTPNTFLHGVEEEAEVPYCLDPQPVDYTCVLEDGRRLTGRYTPHGFRGVIQRYDRAADLPGGNILRRGKAGTGTADLFDAARLREAALSKMRETPCFFVDFADAEKN
ncbi:MAG TPA: AAC(3) family N-acetyltransferase [Firmicutes bacterium]|nr:AAC(3) family N-acetyltransferase [Bacillota bacterium]